MARVTGKEELPLPPQCPYAFPEFLCELVEMMSSYEPRQRPTARLTCQGFEDNLIFPKEIDLQVAESEYPVETQIGYSYPSWTQEMTRQWITAEREQMGNFVSRVVIDHCCKTLNCESTEDTRYQFRYLSCLSIQCTFLSSNDGYELTTSSKSQHPNVLSSQSYFTTT
jgi:hypothetical protein